MSETPAPRAIDLPDPGPLPSPDSGPAVAVDDAWGGGEANEVPAAAQAHGTETPAEPYDPALHESPPRTTRRGGTLRWARRRGGARKSTSRADAPVPEPAATAAAPDDATRRANAEALVAVGLAAAVAAFGDDMAPTDDERKLLNVAAGNYMASLQTDPLTPGATLLAVCGMYFLRRWNRPTVSAARAAWWRRAAAWLGHRYVDARVGADPQA